jgi:HEAT repeat protein
MQIVDRTGAGRRLVAGAVVALVGLGGCSRYIGTTAGSFLRHAREDRDPNLRHLAYARLADPHCYDDEEQKTEAVKLLASRLEERKEPVITRALICRSLGELRHPDGREALCHACDDEHPVIRAAACRSLGMIGRTEDAPVLARIMAADTDSDCRIAAIEGLGAMKAADNRVLETLADGMENPDPSIRLASYVAIQRLTNKDVGTDSAAWKHLVADRAKVTDSVVQKASAETPKTSSESAPKATTEAPKTTSEVPKAAKAPKTVPGDFQSPPTPELR